MGTPLLDGLGLGERCGDRPDVGDLGPGEDVEQAAQAALTAAREAVGDR